MAQEFGVAGCVQFLGGVSRQWVRDNCASYAAMVLPFCKVEGGIMDTGPLVIKEALALKLPLLTTDIMATGEFVDSNSAFISNSSDPEDLARTLLKLLVALDFVALEKNNLDELQQVLGPKVYELSEVINHPKPKKIIEDKINQGYRKVVAEYSSRKQGLMLSKIFQSV
jgi:glycosyltransferase involved in cell wall biosynthesis